MTLLLSSGLPFHTPEIQLAGMVKGKQCKIFPRLLRLSLVLDEFGVKIRVQNLGLGLQLALV